MLKQRTGVAEIVVIIVNNMDKDTLQEINVIIDSFEFEIADLKSAIYKIEDKIKNLKELINPKEEF